MIIFGDLHLDSHEELIDEKISILDNNIQKYEYNIIFLGDIFNNRKSISTIAAQKIQNLIKKYNDRKFYMLVGNHDMYYVEKISPNSLETTFSNFDNVIIIDKPFEIDNFLLIPWICKENYEICVDAIKSTDKKYLCGHLEINSFYMTKGIECHSKFKIFDFDKFEWVLSGHFHNAQQKNNIIYVGSILQESWNDFNNQKRFIIINNDKIESIDTCSQVYKHLILENKDSNFNIDEYKDCHVKIFHNEKLSKKQFDKIELLTKEVRSYKIFDESVELNEVKIERIEFSEVLNEFFQHQHEIEDDFKNDVKDYLLMKYNEV